MERTITIRAQASVTRPVDQVLVYFTLLGKDPSYEQAAALEARRLHLLEQAAAACGYAAEDLKTNSYEIQTEYESFQENGVYRNRLVGFLCRQELVLKLPFDTAALGRLLSAVSGSGAEAELRLEFTLRDPQPAKDALLREAVKTGQARAGLLCEASGVRLGALLRIEHGAADHGAISPSRFEAANTLMAAKRVSIPDLAPQGVNLQDEVTMTWAIEE